MRSPIAAAAARKAPSEDMPARERRREIWRIDRHAVLGEAGGHRCEARVRLHRSPLVGTHDPVGEQRAAPNAEALSARVLRERDARR